MFFLQRKSNAKRMYATFVHSKSNNDGFKQEGITFPSGESQIRLMKGFYEDIKMDPSTIDYIEAHATGTKVQLILINFQPRLFATFFHGGFINKNLSLSLK